MGNISNEVTTFAQGLYETSATKKHNLGARRQDAVGREYRYARNGATALVAGKACVGANAIQNHFDCSVAAAAIGATSVTVTLGATAAIANEYADGFLVVNDGTGEGHSYAIASHPAAEASATLQVKLHDAIRVALVAGGTSQVTLYPSPWYGVVISATATNLFAGVPMMAVPANHYFWILYSGFTAGLIQQTAALGTGLILGSTDGNFDITTTSPVVTTMKCGVIGGYAGVATEYNGVMLTGA